MTIHDQVAGFRHGITYAHAIVAHLMTGRGRVSREALRMAVAEGIVNFEAPDYETTRTSAGHWPSEQGYEIVEDLSPEAFEAACMVFGG